MARLEGVKTIDMAGGEITKVEYNGVVYERHSTGLGNAQTGDLFLSAGGGYTTSGGFYEITLDNSSAFSVRYVDDEGDYTGYKAQCVLHTLFRKVDTMLRTIKRKARVGERILITNASGAQVGIPYKNGDILTVTIIGLLGLVICGKHSSVIDEEYEVIIDESTPKFKEGDRVKTLADGEDGDIKAGEIGVIQDMIDDGDDPYNIAVQTEDDYDYFRPQDLELVAEEVPYKPSEGDIVVITAKTNSSRNKVGDIGKVGEASGYSPRACVHVPGRPDGFTVKGNWTLFSEMRPATDAEKAEYEKAVKFAEIGRKPGEFKKGDIVRGHRHDDVSRKFIGIVEDVASDMIGVIEEDRTYHATCKKDAELIAPVEARVDL